MDRGKDTWTGNRYRLKNINPEQQSGDLTGGALVDCDLWLRRDCQVPMHKIPHHV